MKTTRTVLMICLVGPLLPGKLFGLSAGWSHFADVLMAICISFQLGYTWRKS